MKMRQKKIRYPVKIWREIHEVEEESEEAAEWFSKFLVKPVRLVKRTDNFTRKVEDQFALPDLKNKTSLADRFPFLVCSVESLANLNVRIQERKKEQNETQEQPEIGMTRFRPNIILEGLDHPWEEDEWKRIKFSSPSNPESIELHLRNPCYRCNVPRTNPTLAKIDGPDPTATLLLFHEKEGHVYFGAHALSSNYSGKICVGDVVQTFTD